MPHPTRSARLRHAALAVLLCTAAAGANAQLRALTVYGGARGGGGFDDANHSSTSYQLDSAPAFSASIDWPWSDGQLGQVFFSHQRSALPGVAFGQSAEVPVNVSYLHIGGRYFFEGDARSGGGYVVGGLGASFFSPGLSGLSDEVRASGNLGLGWQWPLAQNVALRTELRGYLSLINAGGGFFCSGGCVVSISGSTLTQFEAMLGLSVGF